ncbi:50S ribosomal protein L21 [Pseudohoeflea coraliihabitans]|uniref:Large ribosomal subunit protein bL21 n=1 Tax=Pseudohoeflea coraliihabitans TaxID=2860393 RepID=A0ABS6WL59_9HYPH|nr:50S ribosomal protein L21 [Pseudohoeflea sp. DP4N28-3]MBW3096696.1 50S ribosomal protein L21 [Pseudohoeflea sp. DP4N28-3]
MFAVIKTGGKQYRVSTDDVLTLEKLDGEAGDSVEFAEVLMVGEGAGATIGAPFVDGAMVVAEVVEQGRARKVLAFKKRRRQNSKRIRGHRQHQTVVRITDILTDGAKPAKKAAKPAAKKASETKPAETAPKTETKSEAKTETKSAAKSADKGKGDDLTKVKGIGPVAAGQLADHGITSFAQLAALSDDEIAKIDADLPFSADQITDWRDQAKQLA